jgi:hypothetical protein
MWFKRKRKALQEDNVSYSSGFRDAYNGIPPQHKDTQYMMGYRDFMSQWSEED